MSALGKHSTDPAAYWPERQKERSQFTHDLGDHILTLDPTYKLYLPSRKDGRPVEKSLSGRRTSPEAFALRLNQLNK
ncbi:MAG: hypothetical protein MO852_15840 [Candidatus Devosia euplotis]|nr:hypothetical protein [Candidatus Devosia euplotis]